jgi:hypothetical protein
LPSIAIPCSISEEEGLLMSIETEPDLALSVVWVNFGAPLGLALTLTVCPPPDAAPLG